MTRKEHPAKPFAGYGTPRRRRTEIARDPLHDVIASECARRGLKERRILFDWPLIAGRTLAAVCLPARITYSQLSESKAEGTLHLILTRPGAALELQTAQPRILEALASYLGHRAVRRIAVKQVFGQLAARRAPERRVPPPDHARRAKLADLTEEQAGKGPAAIDDPRLAAALKRLADAMCGLSRDK